MNKLIAEKCDKCGLLKAGHLHQFPVCAMEVIKKKNEDIDRLKADVEEYKSGYESWQRYQEFKKSIRTE